MNEHFTGTPPTSRTDPQFVAGLLSATLTARKIPAIVALAWDGPQLAVYTVSLGLGALPEQVEALAGALALAAGAESCRVARAAGHLLLELAKPAGDRRPLRATRLDHLTAPTPTAVPLGITTNGRVLWLDLADERFCHVAIGGTTGSGKSVLLRWLLYRLVVQNAPDALRLLLVDPKRFELGAFACLPHLLHPVVTHPLDIARVLAWLTGELDRRADNGRTSPRVVAVIEEVADVVSQNKAVLPALARVAQVGRALGMHVIVTTQQPGAKSLGDSLVNFPARILGRVASSTLTYGAAGRGKSGADVLLGKGDMLLLAAGETIRFQAPLPDGRQWGRLPYAAQVASLEAELPTSVAAADFNRDPRGGYGRRDLSAADYAAIQAALDEGADEDDLRGRFGIGWSRATRLVAQYRGEA
jgi:S-DNA-T family DNA segregation ATPase FtsK/SpoIIIE